MSVGSSSTKQMSDDDVEVIQEEVQLAAGAEAHVEQAQESAEDETESTGSAGADDASDQSAESTRPKMSSQTCCAGLQDSQESSVSGSGSGTESQQGSATGGSGTESQQGSATGGSGTESQQGGATCGGSGTDGQQGVATGGVCRQPSQESTASTGGSGTESRQGSGSGRESQLLGAVGGISRQDSQGSTTAYSSSIGDSQETALACDSSGRDSLESSVAGGVTSRQISLESGVAGGISNSTDTQESPNNGTESFEGVAPPLAAVRHSVRRSARVEFRENVDERAQETEELRRYDQCFSKCACVCDYLRPCSRWIRRSKIFMFLKLILLIIPISAFCMGLKYVAHCPVGEELPILMMLMGIAGVILLASSLALASRRVLCPGARLLYFKALIIASRVMLLGLFAAGLESTYKMSPSFDPSHQEHYCDRVFYYYAYYTNFVVIGLAVLAFFIYVPSLNENMEDYEQL